MARKYIDCRDHPGDVKCTVALSADSEEELMAVVVQHAKTAHKYEITPEFRLRPPRPVSISLSYRPLVSPPSRDIFPSISTMEESAMLSAGKLPVSIGFSSCMSSAGDFAT
jgi:predicted small metal-binding protein